MPRLDAHRLRVVVAALVLAAQAATAACGSGGDTFTATKVERQPVPDGPVLLRFGVDIRAVARVEPGSVGLARSPADGLVYVLHPDKGIFRLTETGVEPVAPTTAIFGSTTAAGMAFAPNGDLYVSGNRAVEGTQTQAIVVRGRFTERDGLMWDIVFTTAPYPLGNTPFDHRFSGLAVSPDGKWLFVTSGSRTDHGEEQSNGGAYAGAREVPMTSAIFRVPADAAGLVLPNDGNALAPYLFADGVRNAYDLAFAPDGELFAIDNGPDADYPDELNWIRQGRHYGFPWRFGTQDNPQQFPGYDPEKDVRLSSDFAAVKAGTYRTDPGFPAPPKPGPSGRGGFVDPIVSRGPDAAHYRGDDGRDHDAGGEGKALQTFTPHRTPLGLVFASAPPALQWAPGGGDLSAFLLSWGASGGDLSDRGEDLLHLSLTRRGDSYVATVHQIARGFDHPIDAVLVENRLYVLEFGERSTVWELKV